MKIPIKCQDKSARVKVRNVEYTLIDDSTGTRIDESEIPFYAHEVLARQFGISPNEVSNCYLRR
jgi:hypothetical protein